MEENKKSVLIIEDDKFLRDLTEKAFKKENLEVFIASEGEEAIKIAKDKIPSVILLDIILPGLDGFEILKLLKVGDATKKIPVILFTNLGSQEDMASAKALGADAFLVKAHNSLDEIVKKVREYL